MIESYIQMILAGEFNLEKLLNESGKNGVQLQRDKFNLALAKDFKRWKVVGESEPSIQERISCNSNGFKYHVGDCGMLTFAKVDFYGENCHE